MKWLVTGGAGFIGTNLGLRVLSRGDRLVVLDDLSRQGSELNLQGLRTHGVVEFLRIDMRSDQGVREALRTHADCDVIVHLAAQVAVTTSILQPMSDFAVNALGTMNLLEAVRDQWGLQAGEGRERRGPLLLYASTNKVYGDLANVPVSEGERRYRLTGMPAGIDESQPLDFYSPYGCSKGTADQYVHDYARIYGLRTVVLRQSCIYGRHQLGVEDQGWVAWLAVAALRGWPVTVYGTGKQVRDLLFADDLIDLYETIGTAPDPAIGNVYNVGGGSENTRSVLELLDELGSVLGRPVPRRVAPARAGDQLVFVADCAALERDVGWAPRTGVGAGLGQMVAWLQENSDVLDSVYQRPAAGLSAQSGGGIT